MLSSLAEDVIQFQECREGGGEQKNLEGENAELTQKLIKESEEGKY